MDEEPNPFDKDWESFPPEELADHCGISDLFYWQRYDEDPEARPNVPNPWTSVGPERKVGLAVQRGKPCVCNYNTGLSLSTRDFSFSLLLLLLPSVNST